MRRFWLAFSAVMVIVATAAVPARAITFGQPDGSRHPQVGALLADYDDESPGPEVLCSGTLIAPSVFLTAGHCTDFLESEGISQVWVTFVSAYDEDSAAPGGLVSGTYVTHPDYGYSGKGGHSDPHDLAVVLLDSPVGITPAQLPTAGLLDQLNLRGRTFTAVGYGTVREIKTTGPHAFFFDVVRRYALQSFLSLQPSWLTLNMNPSTGSGGTCYGDSGGPHFLGGVTSNLLVSITVTGDAMCRATDTTYRLDTASARAFLDDFVTLP
jgi:secreted trypsin-like serine protease